MIKPVRLVATRREKAARGQALPGERARVRGEQGGIGGEGESGGRGGRELGERMGGEGEIEWLGL